MFAILPYSWLLLETESIIRSCCISSAVHLTVLRQTFSLGVGFMQVYGDILLYKILSF